MENTNRYTRIAVALHWIIAALMLANIVLAWIVDELPDEHVRFAIDTHKSIGITVLGFFVLRVLWRLGHRPPALPSEMSKLERAGAHLGHIALYALMLGLPLSGWLHDSAWKDAATHPMSLFGVVPWPRISWVMGQEPGFKEHLHELFGEAHEWLATLFYVLFALHILGALKHQWLDKQRMLQRMWF
jgi:cytochrome b561